MELRLMGKTGLKVSALGFGTYELRLVDFQQSDRLLNEALDSGVNFIDTAPCYGPSEEYIGKAISKRRDEYILESKCGCLLNVKAQGHAQLYDRKTLTSNIDNSLKLLKTDHIDIWLLHGVLPEDIANGRNDDVIKTMQDLKQEGKVLHIGASFKNGGPKDALYPAGFGLMSMREFIKWEVFDVIQIVYGGLTRKNEEAISTAAGKGIGIVARGLVKKYLDNYDLLFEKTKLSELFEKNEDRNSFLIRFALSHPGISTGIIGTKDIAHWKENIKTANRGALSSEIYAEAKRRLDSVGVVSEVF